MKRRLLISLFIQVIWITPSCSQMKEEKQLKCFHEEVEKLKPTFEYMNVMKNFQDTLNSWIERDIKAVRYLKREEWKISEAVFFNKDKSKCLLLYATIDPDTSAVHDEVQIVGAEKISNAWQFYIQSYPNVSFNRNDLSSKQPFTADTMFYYVTKDLIDDGYFHKNSCEINYSYIDSDIWFADWMRQKHQEFLQSKW
ncbi:MAG: hypothetical protein IPG01_03280 [Chitinophagaceae bacterium]|nr:hypothetical protein [Chitinophagaceae bacterium]